MRLGIYIPSEIRRAIQWYWGRLKNIDDILVLSKEILSNNKEHLEFVFARPHAVGLKVNSPKCSFGLTDIPYLDYVITQNSIKPSPNKLQGIMYLRRPTNMIEVLEQINMVQYYSNICPRWSQILSTLTEAYEGTKFIKILVMMHWKINSRK